MTDSQRIALRLSEIRQALNEWPEDGDAAELDKLTAEYRQKESEYRAALVKEDTDSGPTRNSNDGEGAELRRMFDAASFGNYLAAAAGRRGAEGRERELNEALGIAETGFPLDLIAPPEHRAAINGEAQENQGGWLDRLFHESAAQRLGISFRSVAPGVAAYPVTTGGAAGAQRGRAEAVAAGTFAFSVTELKPARNSILMEYTIEDAARMPGLADAIERDMRMALPESIDKAIFLGDTGANENSADVTGLTTASITELEITQANKVKGPETLTVFANLLDGQYAASPGDLRIVAAEGANTLWMTTLVNSAASNETLAEFLRRNGINWTLRGDIETATANGDFMAFVGLGRGIEGAGIAAVWQQGQMIVDPYTKASEGQIALTLQYLWQFGLPRAANFRRLKAVA